MEQGKGTWLERHSFNFGGGTTRLRVSVNSKLEESLVSCNYQQLELAQKNIHKYKDFRVICLSNCSLNSR